MERLLLVIGIVIVASLLAALAQRRRPDAPTRTGFAVPDQLDRSDFDRPEAPWLVAVFGSRTCATCETTWEKARQLDAGDVAVLRIDVEDRRDLHARYLIEAVPLVVVADGAGTVRSSFLGPPTATDLWAAVAELREPGSVPPGCASND